MRVRGVRPLHVLTKEREGPLQYTPFVTPTDDKLLLRTVLQGVPVTPRICVALRANARSQPVTAQGRDIIITVRGTLELPTKHPRAAVIEAVSTIEDMVWIQPWEDSDPGRTMMQKLLTSSGNSSKGGTGGTKNRVCHRALSLPESASREILQTLSYRRCVRMTENLIR